MFLLEFVKHNILPRFFTKNSNAKFSQKYFRKNYSAFLPNFIQRKLSSIRLCSKFNFRYFKFKYLWICLINLALGLKNHKPQITTSNATLGIKLWIISISNYWHTKMSFNDRKENHFWLGQICDPNHLVDNGPTLSLCSVMTLLLCENDCDI